MNCPGSVGLLTNLKLAESDEPEYRSEGTSAHAAGHKCLLEGLEAWEIIGQKFEKHTVDPDMAEAVQVYLDEINRVMMEHPGGKSFLEFAIDNPEFHPSFYGTLDFGYVAGSHLFIRDYKHGEGVAVDVEWNPQIMYYAFGLLRHHPEVTEVSLGIVQPRAFHADGKVRIWVTSADSIRSWAEGTLKPAMERTAFDNDLDAGKWCRFCPAKLVCPLMNSLFGAAMTCNPDEIINITDASLGRSYQYVAAVKSYLKALEEQAFLRLQGGMKLPGIKLVEKKSNRVFKPGAEQTFVAKYGSEAYNPKELKSPAEMSKLGEAAKLLVNEWAFKPQTGLTVATLEDKRPEVKAVPGSETFAKFAVDTAS